MNTNAETQVIVRDLVLTFVLSTNQILFTYRDPSGFSWIILDPSTSYLEPSKAFKTNIHCINEEFCKFLLGWFAIRDSKIYKASCSAQTSGQKRGA